MFNRINLKQPVLEFGANSILQRAASANAGGKGIHTAERGSTRTKSLAVALFMSMSA